MTKHFCEGKIEFECACVHARVREERERERQRERMMFGAKLMSTGNICIGESIARIG